MNLFAHALVTLSLVAGAHFASAADPTPTVAEPALTRAQVQAELAFYRESGLKALDEADTSPLSFEYTSAWKRYAELRSSPRYAQLVRDYATRRDARAPLASH